MKVASIWRVGMILMILSGCSVATHQHSTLPAGPGPDRVDTSSAIAIVPESVAEVKFAECVHAKLHAAMPSRISIPWTELRNTLFPWFEPSTFPRTDEEAVRRLGQPLVQRSLRELRLRYVVLVAGHTRTTTPQTGAFSYIFGATWNRRTELSVEMWDVVRLARIGQVSVEKSGEGAFWIVLFLPVYMNIPTTQSDACAAVGEQVAAFLRPGYVP